LKAVVVILIGIIVILVAIIIILIIILKMRQQMRNSKSNEQVHPLVEPKSQTVVVERDHHTRKKTVNETGTVLSTTYQPGIHFSQTNKQILSSSHIFGI
jgi:uncharacterized membrane protein YqiK